MGLKTATQNTGLILGLGAALIIALIALISLIHNWKVLPIFIALVAF